VPQQAKAKPVTETAPRLVTQAPDAIPSPAESVRVAPQQKTESSSVPPSDSVPAKLAEGKPAETVKQEEAVEPPRFNADYLDNPAPSYPPLSRKLGEQGRVLLRVLVTADGVPSQVTLHKSSGYARLDEVAADTVRRWKFVSARQGSQPVEAWVIVPIQFNLKG
jgi:protein TonB